MAWGVNNGLLDARAYVPAIYRGWKTMATDCLHPNGFLGFVQGTGKEPKDGQPVTYDSMPDFEDYGLGAFLLAACEIIKMI
jgi:rhamnogalacturonyl hydrolase YesR